MYTYIYVNDFVMTHCTVAVTPLGQKKVIVSGYINIVNWRYGARFF